MREEPQRFWNLNGSPWWVRAMAVVGFPALVALFLLAVVVGLVPSRLSTGVDALEQQIRGHMATTEVLVRELARDRAERLWLMRMICRNTAPTERLRIECDRPLEGGREG